MIAARLAGAADFEGWRREARRLAAARIAPDAVAWLVGEEQGGLFEAALEEAGAQQGASGAGLTVPRRFIELAETVICHREPERFGLLYRLLLRLQAEPGCWTSPSTATWPGPRRWRVRCAATSTR